MHIVALMIERRRANASADDRRRHDSASMRLLYRHHAWAARIHHALRWQLLLLRLRRLVEGGPSAARMRSLSASISFASCC